MTPSSQLFLSLNEIVGIRIRCLKCNAAISTPIGGPAAGAIVARFRCPACNAEWFASASDPRSQALERFHDALVEIRGRLAEFGPSGVPVEFLLEIAQSQPEPSR